MKYTFRVRSVDHDIFEAIRAGVKRVETRAATVKYLALAEGDTAIFTCGSRRFERTIRRVQKFKTVSGLLRAYKPKDINPSTTTKSELIAMYDSFPAYHEKIRKFGIISFELSRPKRRNVRTHAS